MIQRLCNNVILLLTGEKHMKIYPTERCDFMSDSQNNIKSISDKVAPIAQRFGIEKVTLFGSMARGDNDKNSDYDFLTSKGNIKTLLQYMDFVMQLEEVFGAHVDVVLESSPDKYIVEAAKKEGVVIYEK